MYDPSKTYLFIYFAQSFPGGTIVKNPLDNAGDTRDAGSIPGSGRPPGGGHGTLLQCSCWEIPMGGL